MKTTKRGDAVQVAWFGWGVMNFISFGLLFVPALLVAVLTGGSIVLRPPDLEHSPVVQTLGKPGTIALGVLLLHATAAFVLNWWNKIIIGPRRIRIRQGIVPWLVSFRRRSLDLADADRFDLESVRFGSADVSTPSYCVVLIYRRGKKIKKIRVTGSFGRQEAAERFCEHLNDILRSART